MSDDRNAIARAALGSTSLQTRRATLEPLLYRVAAVDQTTTGKRQHFQGNIPARVRARTDLHTTR